MALALEGFSIREYAANMRSVDFDKCWPFDGGGGAADEKSLPQISVRKFRIWSEEISSIPIPEKGKAEEIPSAVRTTPSNGKQRTPKKRSIVELFAVAPQIEAAEEEDGDDFESGEEKDAEIKGKEIMEEGEKKGGKINKSKKKRRRRKLVIKSKKKMLKVEICAAKKVIRLRRTSLIEIATLPAFDELGNLEESESFSFLANAPTFAKKLVP